MLIIFNPETLVCSFSSIILTGLEPYPKWCNNVNSVSDLILFMWKSVSTGVVIIMTIQHWTPALVPPASSSQKHLLLPQPLPSGILHSSCFSSSQIGVWERGIWLKSWTSTFVSDTRCIWKENVSFSGFRAGGNSHQYSYRGIAQITKGGLLSCIRTSKKATSLIKADWVSSPSVSCLPEPPLSLFSYNEF